jgi:hypothetical protein
MRNRNRQHEIVSRSVDPPLDGTLSRLRLDLLSHETSLDSMWPRDQSGPRGLCEAARAKKLEPATRLERVTC